MTTKCVELGRHKCTQYWPDEGIVKYGNVTVTVAKLQQCDGYELRTMTITSAVRVCVCVCVCVCVYVCVCVCVCVCVSE